MEAFEFMRTLAISILLLAGAALFLLAAPVNVSGTWSGNMTADTGATVDVQFQLKQVGDDITGAAGPKGAVEPIYDATIQGDHLKFSVGHDPKPVWNFDLTVSTKEMQGRGEGKRGGQDLGRTTVEMRLQQPR
jgi:hypothetical protein